MKEKWNIFFIGILLLSAVAFLINLSQSYTISIDKPFPIHYQFSGIKTIFSVGPLHVKQNLSLRRGLDLQGGTSITLRADMTGIPKVERQSALDSAQSVIERRVNFFGVSEPVVQTQQVNGDYRILVELPGVTDVHQAVSLVGQTAKLTFWEQVASDSARIASFSALPLGVPQIIGPYASKTTLSGSDLQQATVTFNPQNGTPEVQLTFTSEGAKKFADITARNVGKIVPIVLDNQVVEAPRVNEPIYGGNAVITGNFTTAQANTIAIQLNAGALPVPLQVLQQRGVGATLGQESLNKSVVAGLIGFLVIVVFMVSLYGKLGIIASCALVLYTLLVLSIFRVIPVTLTLAGIAGFILSIGIAVDANILIFERMKEELRRGRPFSVAVDLGFSRAWPSIRDSNIASLITSSILYYFGTGIVRGFALTLAIGVLVSMFSAIFVTRTLLKVFYKK